MSIQQEIAIGYGIIVDSEKVTEIERSILDEEEYAEFIDSDYIHCINSWVGGDYFIGATNFLGSIEEPLPITDVKIEAEDIKAFEDFLAKQSWHDMIDWKPETYLIEFVF